MTGQLEKTGGFIAHHPWLTTFPLVVVSIISLTIAILAWGDANDAQDRVTVVEQSPCVKDASSDACYRIREEVLKAEPLKITCIPFQRAIPPKILSYTRCAKPAVHGFPGG